MSYTIAVFQRKDGHDLQWTTLGLGPYTEARRGRAAVKLQQSLVNALKKRISEISPHDLEGFVMPRGIGLEHFRLDLNLRGSKDRRRFAGLFPLILVPRWVTREQKITLCYHPERQGEWFPVREGVPLE